MSAEIFAFPTHTAPMPDYDWDTMEPEVADIVRMLEARFAQALMRKAQGNPLRLNDLGYRLAARVSG